MSTDLPPLPTEEGRCEGCGFDFTATSVAAASDVLHALPARYDAAVAQIPDEALRVRPDAATWSVIEYVCHVRDVFASYTIRLYRIRTEECPSIEPMLNDLRAARFGYRNRKISAVLDELADNKTGLLDEAARVRDWDRVATRLPHEQRTARWMIRQAAHEGSHHLSDINAVLGRVTDAPR